MRLDPHRLTFWLALFAAGTTYIALSPSYRQAAPAVRETHWIGLPDSGMDTSAFPLRQLLLYQSMSRANRNRYFDLAMQCGSHSDIEEDRFRERYIARFTESAWEPGWEVVMDVEKDLISFSVRSGDFLPPPLPRQAGAPEMITIRPVTQLRMPKAKVEAIRQAWDEPSLWHAPQKESFCVDGTNVQLEACVHGQYAVRDRRCAEASNHAANALRSAFKTLLPAPEPAYERPAS